MICGIGVVDIEVNKFDPLFLKWKTLIERCFSTKRKESYQGCTVCNEWLVFSKFKDWAENLDWVDKQIDKDIINPGNMHYSPDNCVMVSRRLNVMFQRKRNKTGLPRGVTKTKLKGKCYRAQCDSKYVGQFFTLKEASDAYWSAFCSMILDEVAIINDDRLKSALLNWVDDIKWHLDRGVEFTKLD